MAVFNKLTSLIVTAAAFTCVASLPTFPGLPGLPTLPGSGYTKIDFSRAAEICKTAGPDVFGIVRYGEEQPQAINYGECFIYEEGKMLLDNVYFCKPGNCHVFADGQCEQTALGVPIPIPVGSFGIPIVLDIDQLVGQSAYCQPYHLQL